MTEPGLRHVGSTCRRHAAAQVLEITAPAACAAYAACPIPRLLRDLFFGGQRAEGERKGEDGRKQAARHAAHAEDAATP